MEEALERLPEGLDDAFADTLARIQHQPEARSRLGMKTLMWLAYARRPMTCMQLVEALSIKPNATSSNRKYCPSQKSILGCCLGLVTVDEESSVIRLVHYSVQQYLKDNQHELFPNAESNISEVCITYLLFEPFKDGARDDQAELDSLVHQNPFVEYAASQWGNHLRLAEPSDAERLALRFLEAKAHRACACQISSYLSGYRLEYWRADTAMSQDGLHVAALFGLDRIGKSLIEDRGFRADGETAIGTTPLMMSAAGGHPSFVQMLLEKGADPQKENWYGMALHGAAEAGQVGTINILLNHGVDIDMRDQRGRTALHCATISGHRNAIEKLLKRGAEVNAVCKKNYTTLCHAIVWEKPLEIVQLLLENRASVHLRSDHDVTPLHHAVQTRAPDTVSLLLQYNADVNATDNHGARPIHLAVEINHTETLELLLGKGGDIDARNGEDRTPLDLAAAYGWIQSVEILLLVAASLDPAKSDGLTALDIANIEGHDKVGMSFRFSLVFSLPYSTSLKELSPNCTGSVTGSASCMTHHDH